MLDNSFGIIPIRLHRGNLEYLLIQHQVGHWGFPKGHKNAGESDADTARREFMEETGLKLEKVYEERSFDERYSFVGRGEHVDKTVRYFVGLVADGEMKVQEIEIKNAAWLPYQAAMERLDYPEAKRILKSASTEFISKLNPAELS
ncbi:MAG: NUDIX domain-containing protein [Patescibacteria group bacterium]